MRKLNEQNAKVGKEEEESERVAINSFFFGEVGSCGEGVQEFCPI